ncbi:MAG: hypothetical protein V9H25_12365 [Candidatus Competibacter sp.]
MPACTWVPLPSIRSAGLKYAAETSSFAKLPPANARPKPVTLCSVICKPEA